MKKAIYHGYFAMRHIQKSHTFSLKKATYHGYSAIRALCYMKRAKYNDNTRQISELSWFVKCVFVSVYVSLLSNNLKRALNMGWLRLVGSLKL